jgi:hypothetical protein
VNHEVEDDVDVERARREDTEAVGLEEHGPVESGDGRGDGWVEAFEMANGDDAVVGVSRVEDAIGLGECGGEGLLDEDVEAGKQKLLCDGGVVDGRDADGCGVEWQICGKQFCERREGGNVVGSGEAGAASGVGFDKSGELNEFRVSVFELAVDAEMIAPEGASPNDGYA